MISRWKRNSSPRCLENWWGFLVAYEKVRLLRPKKAAVPSKTWQREVHDVKKVEAPWTVREVVMKTAPPWRWRAHQGWWKFVQWKWNRLGQIWNLWMFFPKKRPNMFDVFFSLTNQHGAFYIKTSWKGRWKADEFNRKRGSSINPFGWRPLSAELLVGDPEFPEGPGWQWSSPQRFFFDVRTSEFPPVCSRKWQNLSQILGPRCVLLEVMVTQF